MAVESKSRAVFLDKDGTLVPDIPYNADPARISLMAGAGEALRDLHAAGFKLIVVSNQSGVARGLFPEEALVPVEQRLSVLFRESGSALAGWYYCPHHPAGVVARYARECGCRKPKPEMLIRAAQEHRIDLSRSWMVGDILNDVEAGRRAGCRTVLLDNGNETEWVRGQLRVPDYVAQNWQQVARRILEDEYTPTRVMSKREV